MRETCRHRCIALLLIALLLAAGLLQPAPATAQTPAPHAPPASPDSEAVAEAALAWLAAFAGEDGNATLRYTCRAQRAQLPALYAAGRYLPLPAEGKDARPPEADLSDVTVTLLDATAAEATVLVQGELRVARGATAAALDLDEEWQLLFENNTWRWCTAAGEPASPAASADDAPAFATPEAAVESYLAAIGEANLARALEATALDEVATQSDFVATAERLQALMLQTGYAPAEYPFFAEINAQIFGSRIAGQARNLAYALLAGVSDDDIAVTIVLRDEPDLPGEFVAAVDPARLAGIDLLAIADPAVAFAESTSLQKNFAASAATLGADEIAERVALFAFEGDTFLVGFQLARYGEQWLIVSQHSNLVGQSALGTPLLSTAEAFYAEYGE